ncbi:hypothetical protein SAMN02745172_01731 [Pseudoxanthobacter soli DSM 19599]|uniref:Uncharacterized protein n=1 Tax=Pseudoxanthobacter soli DSM 19599 TaxID=1123029 RepID=A0A1M7ZI41_9HYPH|nr:hypothetical protein [Pseudoxanthobacter soli]SHO64492.1 hypothetical protein SAMN02745172_01731 [Pseudoxanthobacter soli DSM 19599]
MSACDARKSDRLFAFRRLQRQTGGAAVPDGILGRLPQEAVDAAADSGYEPLNGQGHTR